MEDREEITRRVFEVIVEHFNDFRNSLDLDTKFYDDLNCDSLDVVELVMDLEDEFSVVIPDDALDSIKTIGGMITYIGTALELQ